jgi:mannose-6-phosphate isomerase-like protein (cupin superfamily)
MHAACRNLQVLVPKITSALSGDRLKVMKAVHVSGERKMLERGSQRAWGAQAWLATRALTGSSLSLTRMIMSAGHSAEAHQHPNADEVIYVIKGSADVSVDGKTFSLDATDALAIPAGLSHQIHNPGAQELELILCYSSGERAYEPTGNNTLSR